jgi:hypothetical protein
MELSNKKRNEIMEQLRATLLKDIELQEKLRVDQKRSKKLGWAILSCLLVIILILAGFVIYFKTRSKPASEITLEYIQNEKKGIELERKMLMLERNDVAIARGEVLEMISKMDSILKPVKKQK